MIVTARFSFSLDPTSPDILGGHRLHRRLRALLLTVTVVGTTAIASSSPSTSAAIPSAAIVTAPTTTAQQDQATLLVADRVGGMALLGQILYWHTDCGGEFAPAQSRLRALATTDARSGPTSPGSAQAQTLYESPSSRCPGDRIASANVAVFGDAVYWITGDGRIVSLARTASAGDTPRTVALAAGAPSAAYPNGASIAADNTYLYWSDGRRIMRLSRADGGATTLVSDGTAIHDLRTSGDGILFYLDGRRLRSLLPFRTGYLRPDIASNVGGYALDEARVYWATATEGTYTILSERHDLRDRQVHYRDNGRAHPHQHVDALTVDAANIYWHVVVDRTGGPLVRLARTSQRPVAISAYRLLGQPLLSDGHDLFWTDYNTGIFRLPVSAASVEARTTALPVVSLTDVSPDRPYGDTHTHDDYDCCGADPGGQVESIVVDPTDSSTLYVASQYAGVWKSTDGGVHWRQASKGLLTGLTVRSSRSLAIDSVNPARLLYVAQADDRRPDTPFGGLWTSLDRGEEWHHVDITACPAPNAQEAAFSAGQAFVVTRCGLLISADLRHWTRLETPFAAGATLHIAALGGSVFACAGTALADYEPEVSTPTWHWQALTTLPGTCFDLAGAPSAFSTHPDRNVVVLHTAGDGLAVSLLSRQWFEHTWSRQSLGFNRAPSGSGDSGVYVAPWSHYLSDRFAPGAGYDVFASDGKRFYEWVGDARWQEISHAPLHDDTHAMAFPATYAPQRGVCRAFAATDGGVSADIVSGRGSCVTADGPWARAMSGLHAYNSYGLAGVHQRPCGQPLHACPALYVASGDNGFWFSTSGGLPGSSWTNFTNCCGDNGLALVDPALPGQVVGGRNGYLMYYRSADGTPPTRAAASDNFDPPNRPEGAAQPPHAAVAQIITLSGEPVAPQGDYVAIQTVTDTAAPFDHIVRTRDHHTWRELSPQHFAAHSLVSVRASGGHVHPTIYVLDTIGTIWRGMVDHTGSVPRFEIISHTLGHASNLFVDPYHPDALYIADAHAIKSSSNGGRSWSTEDVLTTLATQDSAAQAAGRTDATFTYGCTFDRNCPLMDVVFTRDDPTVRVALLFPNGVALSRDAGVHWIPIDQNVTGITPYLRALSDLLAHPFSGYYDADSGPLTGSDTLYLAMRGRGVVRLDGSFATVEQLEFAFCPADECGGIRPRVRALAPRLDAVSVRTGASQQDAVVAIDDTTGARVTLRRGSDGVYRGAELFDSAGRSVLRYHIERNKVVVFRAAHTLTAAERHAGVVALNAKAATPPIRQANLPTIASVTTPSFVVYGPCVQGPQTVKVVLTVRGEGSALTASLLYRYAHERSHGERDDAFVEEEDGPLHRLAMTRTGGSAFTATIDLRRDMDKEMVGEDGAIRYLVQLVRHTRTADTILGRIELKYCAAPSQPTATATPKGVATSTAIAPVATATTVAPVATPSPTAKPTASVSPTATPTVMPPAISTVVASPDPAYYGQCQNLPTSVTVSAHISAPSGLGTVTLHYRYVSGNAGVPPGAPRSVETVAPHETYSATVSVGAEASPDLRGTNGTLKYQIQAIDTAGRSSSSLLQQVQIQYCPG